MSESRRILDLAAARRILAPDDAALPEGDAVRMPPGYDFVRRLGGGGAGEVVLAVQTATGRPVALKLMRRALGESPTAARAWRELHVLAQVRLDRAPRLLDYGTFDGHMFLAMEVVEGAPIDAHVRDAGLDRAAIVALVVDAARTLHALHERGILHRDVKPSNILVAADGRPVLIDFGLAALVARDVVETITAEGAPIGTPAFMSPEQARGEREAVSVRSDEYALAATLCALLTGETPHDVRTSLHEAVRRVAADPPRDPRTLDPHLPRGLAAVLRKALAPDAADRYPSVAAFADDLERWRRGEPVEAGDDVRLRVRRAARRHPLAVAVAAAALAIVATVATIRQGPAVRDRWRGVIDLSREAPLAMGHYSGMRLGEAVCRLPGADDAAPAAVLSAPGESSAASAGAPPGQTRWITDAGVLYVLDGRTLNSGVGELPRSYGRTEDATVGPRVPGVATIKGDLQRRRMKVALVADLDGDGLADLVLGSRAEPAERAGSTALAVPPGGGFDPAPKTMAEALADEGLRRAECVRIVRGSSLPPLLAASYGDGDGDRGAVLDLGRDQAGYAQAVIEIPGFTTYAEAHAVARNADGRCALVVIDDRRGPAGAPALVEDRHPRFGNEIVVLSDVGRPEAPRLRIRVGAALRRASAGLAVDLDGDGRTELVIATPQADAPWAGATPSDDDRRPGIVWIVPGTVVASVWAPDAPAERVIEDIAAVARPIVGTLEASQLGDSLAATDLDGDGVPDLAIGQTGIGNYDDHGDVYVVFGGAALDLGLREARRVDRLGSPVLRITAPTRAQQQGDMLGTALVGGFDFDGDGLEDLAACASRANANGNDSGAIYIVRGASERRTEGTIAVRAHGFVQGGVIWGSAPRDQLGAMAAVPDLDGDGCDELLVGSPFSAIADLGSSGAAYLIRGRPLRRWPLPR